MSSIMNAPALRITINTTPGKMTIKNKSIRFTAKTDRPEMTVETQKPQLDMDWNGYWSQVGYSRPRQLAEQQASQGKQGAEAGTAKYSQDGDTMSASQNLNNNHQTIPQMALRDSKKDIKEINVKSTPETPPSIAWDKGSITIDWSEPSLEISWDTDFRPEIEYSAASVEINVTSVERKRFAMTENVAPGVVGKRIKEDI